MDGNKPGSREPDFEPCSKKQKQKSEKTNKEEIEGEQGIEGGWAPSRFKKEGTSSLPTQETTRRLPELGEGDGRCVGGGEGQLEHWQLLNQEGMLVQAGGKLDGRLPAVCAEPLQLHRDGGGASQVLVARMVELL